MGTAGAKNGLALVSLGTLGCSLLIGAAVAAKSLIATELEIAALLEKVEPVPVKGCRTQARSGCSAKMNRPGQFCPQLRSSSTCRFIPLTMRPRSSLTIER